MTSTPQTIALAPILDPAAAPMLLAELRQARGHDLRLNGAAVERLGAPCLQVLLAAQSAWRADGTSFAIDMASEAMRESLRLMGADALAQEGCLS